MTRIKMPAGATYLLDKLAAEGFSAYIVGGCVRDSLLGLAPKDWDVCTAAKPREVEACFAGERIIETGMKHGTVTVLLPDGQYEVTTFRIDGTYSDNRRPDRVEFVRDIHADLARRDFTVNAMAYNEREGLIDPFGGREDLEKGLIRCVGDPAARFAEDGLRIMRAIRFASVYGFPLDPQTASAVHKQAYLLENIAAERIREELCKLLGGKDVSKILLSFRDCLTVIVPEAVTVDVAQNASCDPFTIAACALSLYRENDICVRMALFLLGVSGRQSDRAEAIMRRLRLDNRTRRDTLRLVTESETPLEPTQTAVRHLLSEMGEAQFFRLIQVKKAIEAARASGAQTEAMREYDAAAALAQKMIAEKQCLTLEDLAVNGGDIMTIGIAEGKKVGDFLTLALNAVLDGTVPNRKEDLLRYLQETRDQK